MPLGSTPYEIMFTKYEQELDNNKAKAKYRYFILSESEHRFGLKLNMNIFNKVKVKSSRNRAGVAQKVPGGLGSQIFMTFGT